MSSIIYITTKKNKEFDSNPVTQNPAAGSRSPEPLHRMVLCEKRTHEELLELALVDVVGKVAHKQLMAVWEADHPSGVHLAAL